MTTRHATPDDGRPSFEARARLAVDLHEQLAASRMAWDAALLRSDAALASGDEAEVQAALDDHRVLLGVLEERLGAVVATATVNREAEQAACDRAVGGPAPRRGPGPPPPGRGLVSTLAGAAAAVGLLAAVLGGDLGLGTDGMFAGTTTRDASEVEARTASSSVTLPDLDGHRGTAGPRAALPRFSGSLPPAAARTGAASVTEPATPGADLELGEAAEAPVGRDDTPTVEVPARGVPTPVETPGPPALPRPEELVERLADREGGDGADTGASLPSLPSPLSELDDVIPAVPAVPPASDPTGGLG